MRLIILLVIASLVFLAPVLSRADSGTNICGGETQLMVPRGYQQLTVSTVALALTVPTAASGIRKAVIFVETNPIRWRDDGTAPTASIGMLQATNSTFTVCGEAIGVIKLIRQGGADAVANISYYGSD